MTLETLVMLVSAEPPEPPTALDTLAQLGPVATGAAAIVALVVGVLTVAQKGRADRRAEWWRRTQWAFELTFHEDPGRQVVGLRALQYLTKSKLAGKDEAGLLASAWVQPLAEAAPAGETSGDETGSDDEGGED